MVAFTQHATALRELTEQVPLADGEIMVKNPEARLRHPASTFRPTEIRHVQQCALWASRNEVGLTIVGGGHSGHCRWPNTVSVDMGSFNRLSILTVADGRSMSDAGSEPLVVAEAGCKTGDIIRNTMAAGLTVPLGARPSVGAGLWLQGGISHLARFHGLACDSIVGAVVVSVDSGEVLCIGRVPSQHQPDGCIRPQNEADWLWAMKGAGTNFGIVISITFKAYAAPTYLVRNWMVPLGDNNEAQRMLKEFDEFVAVRLPRNSSADAYLYWDAGRLHLGVTAFELSMAELNEEILIQTTTPANEFLGTEQTSNIVDGTGLFDTELYVSDMHDGHGGGKTSSFKRCVFLKGIGTPNIAHVLVSAIQKRPSKLCYLHLLQGGGAVSEVAEVATAFGCRDWDFGCVVTGVWLRDQDETVTAQIAIEWVYTVVRDLLPLSNGTYGADLGPDPRDAALAAKAFGPNRPRLSRLKRSLDPYHVLACACPLPPSPKLIILVTGKSCAGKDYCADIWASVFLANNLKAHVVSISAVTKREYAATTGADLNRLLHDRAYKEQHRSALTIFFQNQMQQRPQLLEEHFSNAVYGAADADVLLITGMRDKTPVLTLSHLVPGSRLIEVCVEASEEARYARQKHCQSHPDGGDGKDDTKNGDNGKSNVRPMDYSSNLVFHNVTSGSQAAKNFAQRYLLLFTHRDLEKLARMVRKVPEFPRPDIEFRHVLNISQEPGGLALCASLLQTHFMGDWAKVDVVACCEAGGFIYASPLAALIDVRLALIREAGKLPPPVVSVIKHPSNISRTISNLSSEKRFEMDQNLVHKDASVVVVDDVFATGKTLFAVLRLLCEAGVDAKNIRVITIAEFPVHRGREFLHRSGFGAVNIQSLLVFDGA